MTDPSTTRHRVTLADGTSMFTSPADGKAESEVAALIEASWHCQVRKFGWLAPIDWYATRDERLIGVLELKARTHASTTFPTVYLNVRKWLALSLGEIGLGVPALFVVRFTDDLRWCLVRDVDAAFHRIGGWGTARAQARNDVEPVIEVRVDQMRAVESTKTKGVS